MRRLSFSSVSLLAIAFCNGSQRAILEAVVAGSGHGLIEEQRGQA